MGLQYEKRSGIAHVVIDNGKMNVITPQIHKEFFHRLKEFEIDPDARVGLLYGAGGAPSRPATTSRQVPSTRTPAPGTRGGVVPAPERGRHAEPPAGKKTSTVTGATSRSSGAVSGYCIGAGLAYLLLHTDIRVRDESAKFGLPELGFGAAGLSATTRLARHLAPSAAAYMALTGEFIDAQEGPPHRARQRGRAGTTVAGTRGGDCAVNRPPSPTSVRVEMEALEIAWRCRATTPLITARTCTGFIG